MIVSLQSAVTIQRTATVSSSPSFAPFYHSPPRSYPAPWRQLQDDQSALPGQRLAANEVVGSDLGRQHLLQTLARHADRLGIDEIPLTLSADSSAAASPATAYSAKRSLRNRSISSGC